MTEWFRQHRESVVFRMPWHIEDTTPTGARMLGLLLAVCGTTIASEGRGIDRMPDPPPRGLSRKVATGRWGNRAPLCLTFRSVRDAIWARTEGVLTALEADADVRERMEAIPDDWPTCSVYTPGDGPRDWSDASCGPDRFGR